MQDEAFVRLQRLQRGLRVDDTISDDLDWVASPANLTVMSYNIRGSNLDPVVNTWWQHRRSVLAATILKYRPTIIGTQEGLAIQLRDLMTLLPSSWRLFGGGRKGAMEEDEHVALIYNEDEVQLLKGGDFWLSPTPDVPGSSAWGSAFPRMATWAKFKQVSTGHQFYVVNTHMDHVSEQARVEGARVLLNVIEKLRTKNRAVIVTGDFNAAPGQGSYEVLRKGGFEDAWSTSHRKGTILHQARTTFHHWRGTKLETWYWNAVLYFAFRWHAGRFPHLGRYHIDWILYQNGNSQYDRRGDGGRGKGQKAVVSVPDSTPPQTTVEPLCAMVCTDAGEDGQYPSDHHALLAVFELKGHRRDQVPGKSDPSTELEVLVEGEGEGDAEAVKFVRSDVKQAADHSDLGIVNSSDAEPRGHPG